MRDEKEYFKFEWIYILSNFLKIDERIRHCEEANGLRYPRTTQAEQPEIFRLSCAKVKLIRQFAVASERSISNLI